MVKKIIGLKRHTVKLMPHQQEWKEMYEATKNELFALVGDLVVDIQHVGSTSIPGIVAKPIIDIAIAVDNLIVIGKIMPILVRNNFIYRGDSGNEGGHLFVRNVEFDVRTHHIHIVEKDDVQWINYLLFRDKLSEFASLAAQYSELKMELSKLYTNDRLMYTDSKHDFIRSVLKGD